MALEKNVTTLEIGNNIGTKSRNNFILPELKKLPYEIHRYSSFSINYIPENILVDCPKDQSSRWSANNNNPPQYLTLKLKRPAMVKEIKFGKFEKTHVCNLKKFRIYGGLDEECTELLLEGGLKNDNIPEIFNLSYRSAADYLVCVPVLYIKIVPLLSWGPTFNFSIWYVELHGQDDPMFIAASMKNYNLLREKEIIKLCLKHFRQQGYNDAFKVLQEQTKVQLEHPLVSELHKHLVTNGDFEKAEEFISQCVDQGLMDAYLSRQDYKHTWCIQESISDVLPGNRGGHQLVMHAKRRLIYLYGGWDGFQDLSDFWVFDVATNSWSLIFMHSEQFNGPSPRSCHKMIFDPVSENIFMLGRYLDNSIRTTDYIKSDFYLYDTRAKTWLQICDDTSQVGGPQLVYDHQMCIDAEKRIIYVFGGKILTPRSVTSSSSSEVEYSGLFSYHIATNTWTQILVDCHHPSASQADVLSIKSRITHCMVFHTKTRNLYIYGGQRGKEDIDDFIAYNVDTQAISVLNKDNHNGVGEPKSEPLPGYTLRATIDCERDEIYVFSSLCKLKDRREVQLHDSSNSFWVYSLQTHTWSRIYTCLHNPNTSDRINKNNNVLEPCPRYAHQLVYDDETKLHYLFGGNPGKVTLPQLRLDDFWLLVLEKPKREEILNHCRYLLRKLKYQELARNDPLAAMQYLRNHVSQVIDHSSEKELNEFHKLAALLFKPETNESLENSYLATPSLGNDRNTSIKHVNDSIANISSASDGEDLSIESYESNTTSTSGVSSETTVYHKTGGKRARHEFVCEMRQGRAFLFNRLVQLMPAHMVPPERNLSDFVVI